MQPGPRGHRIAAEHGGRPMEGGAQTKTLGRLVGARLLLSLQLQRSKDSAGRCPCFSARSNQSDGSPQCRDASRRHGSDRPAAEDVSSPCALTSTQRRYRECVVGICWRTRRSSSRRFSARSSPGRQQRPGQHGGRSGASQDGLLLMRRLHPPSSRSMAWVVRVASSRLLATVGGR
jgi:hypothetical protein